MDLPLKEWEKLGISKATYYRHQSHEKSQSQSHAPQSHEPVSRVIFDGYNGNICKSISRAEMKAVLDKEPNHFIPNWYRIGCNTRP